MSREAKVQTGEAAAEYPTNLLIYQDEALAMTIADVIYDDWDRALLQREMYNRMQQHDEDDVFIHLTPEMKAALGLGRVSLFSPMVVNITYGFMAGMLEDTIRSTIDEANSNSLYLEQEVELTELDRLLEDTDAWTSSQTKQYANMALSRWKRLSEESRLDHLEPYASEHPDVRGIRSETLLSFNAYRYEPNYHLTSKPLLDFDEFMGRTAIAES